LVDAAIAVVVDAVADLRGRLAVARAHQCAALAAERTLAADARLTRGARAAATRVALVDLPVAVVILEVARFRCRSARCDVARRAGAVAATDLRSGTLACADSDRARRAQVDERLVGRAVTVVVQAVTGLDHGRARLYADEGAALTVTDPRVADAGKTGGARAAATRIALVSLAVAIVVDAVAALG